MKKNTRGEPFAKQAIALLPEIQKNKISYGRAAEMLGVSKDSLIDFYCNLGFPYIDRNIESVK